MIALAYIILSKEAMLYINLKMFSSGSAEICASLRSQLVSASETGTKASVAYKYTTAEQLTTYSSPGFKMRSNLIATRNATQNTFPLKVCVCLQTCKLLSDR